MSSPLTHTGGFHPLSHYSYLEDNGLVVLSEVEGEHVSVHERGAALAEGRATAFFRNCTSIQDMLCCCISSIFCFT